MQQHIEQGVFLKESGRKVFQVFNQAVIGLRSVHGEIKAVLITLCSIGEITAVGMGCSMNLLEVYW